MEDVEAVPVLREEMEETLNELFTKLKGSFPYGEIPPGRNPHVECIRLTLDPMNPEHRPLAFYFVIPLISFTDSGRLPSTTFRINRFQRSWIHLLLRQGAKSTHARILVPCTYPSCLRSPPSRGHPWRWLSSIINLVCHKSCKSRKTPTHFRPRLGTC